MSISAYGFTPEEINASTTTAYIAAWHEPQSVGKPVTNYLGGTYGLVLAGHGKEWELWGGGHTDSAVPMLGLGIRRALAASDGPLRVCAVRELWEFIGTVGHVRKARDRKGKGEARTSTGKPFKGYEVLNEVMTAMDEGRWTYEAIDKFGGYPGFNAAMGLAKGPAKEAVRQHQLSTSPSFGSATELNAPQRYEVPPLWTIVVEGP